MSDKLHNILLTGHCDVCGESDVKLHQYRNKSGNIEYLCKRHYMDAIRRRNLSLYEKKRDKAKNIFYSLIKVS